MHSPSMELLHPKLKHQLLFMIPKLYMYAFDVQSSRVWLVLNNTSIMFSIEAMSGSITERLKVKYTYTSHYQFDSVICPMDDPVQSVVPVSSQHFRFCQSYG